MVFITYSICETKDSLQNSVHRQNCIWQLISCEIRQNRRYRKEPNLTQKNIYITHIRALFPIIGIS